MTILWYRQINKQEHTQDSTDLTKAGKNSVNLPQFELAKEYQKVKENGPLYVFALQTPVPIWHSERCERPRAVVFITTATAIYSPRHGLCTLPAVPRSTQPSTLHAMVKWVSAFMLSNNNKWRWWIRMVAVIYWRTHSPSRLACSESWRHHSSCIHQINQVYSRNGFGHEDSTINISVCY